MGRNRVVVAVLLEHSVKVATNRESSIEMAKGGISFRGSKLSPSHLDRPEFCKEMFKAKLVINFTTFWLVAVSLYCMS